MHALRFALLSLCLGVLAGCGEASSNEDAGLDASTDSVDASFDALLDWHPEFRYANGLSHAPNCGSCTCNPTTEFCQSIIYESNQSPFYCVVADAGSQLSCADDGCFSDAGIMPGCDDAGNYLGVCGCYQSPVTGLVTITFCLL